MCFPQEIFSAPENTSCSGNILYCYRKYFLSQKIFPVPDDINCPTIYSLLPQEKVPATANISCHRKYFLRYVSLS